MLLMRNVLRFVPQISVLNEFHSVMQAFFFMTHCLPLLTVNSTVYEFES